MPNARKVQIIAPGANSSSVLSARGSWLDTDVTAARGIDKVLARDTRASEGIGAGPATRPPAGEGNGLHGLGYFVASIRPMTAANSATPSTKAAKISALPLIAS